MERLYDIILGFMFGVTAGAYLGTILEAWSWRQSADSHHRSHKSGGRWFHVWPDIEGGEGFSNCPYRLPPFYQE